MARGEAWGRLPGSRGRGAVHYLRIAMAYVIQGLDQGGAGVFAGKRGRRGEGRGAGQAGCAP